MDMTMTTVINHLKEAWSTPRRTSESDPSSPDLDVAFSFSDSGDEQLPFALPPEGPNIRQIRELAYSLFS